MEKPRGARLLHKLLVLYQRTSLYLQINHLTQAASLQLQISPSAYDYSYICKARSPLQNWGRLKKLI